MRAIVHPFLTLLASSSRQDLAAQNRLLKAENKILRSKLPKRITFTDQDRRTVVKHGLPLGGAIKSLLSIVSYSTFRRWVRAIEDREASAKPRAKGKDASKGGRPRTEASVRELVVRMRKECSWGYTKIRQGLARLGHRVSRQTVKNILVAEGIAPEPNDGGDPDSWSEFLKRHANVMWQCDFACKKKWTVKGLVDVYFLVFIHLGTRRIWVSPSTEHPTGQWTTQQARNFQMHVDDEELKCEIISRDNDRKYTDSFDEVFKSTGCTVKRNTPASPNLQAHVERVIQTIKHEILNGFVVVTNQQLDVILRRGSDWYNTRRGHSARNNLPPVRDGDSPPTIDLTTTKIECHTDLGGLLRSYRPAA